MNELNDLYAKFLGLGLISIREAVRAGDLERAEAEVELLHNVPSLIDESNLERHHYFWFTERVAYESWVRGPGREALLMRMFRFYVPTWIEMQQILLDSFSQADMLTQQQQAMFILKSNRPDQVQDPSTSWTSTTS